jgi:hypothetical protein
MSRSNSSRFLFILCIALVAAACGDDGPTEPTPVEPPPPPVTLTGTWSGRAEGGFVTGEAMATLTQTGSDVTGDWSMQMPAALVALGAPAELDLEGPVSGTATGMTAELSFGFVEIEAFAEYVDTSECAIDVSVSSFDATMLEATWATNALCQPPVVDEGTLSFTRE